MKRMLIAAALVTALPVAAYAHHGWSSYDSSKALTVKGKLRTLSCSNPHGIATMDWQGERWTVVLAPTARMEARGLSKAMIAPGKPVTLVGYPKLD